MNNFTLRLLTGTAYVVLLVGCCLWTPLSMLFFFALVAVLSTWEFVRNVNQHAGATADPRFASLASLTLVFALFQQHYLGQTSLYYIYLLVLLYLLIAELYRGSMNALRNWGYAFASQLYIALPLSLPTLLSLYGRGTSHVQAASGWMPLAVFVFLWVSDSGAYLVGSALGKRFPAKLFPSISPNKSWVGSIGGALLCLVAAVLLHSTVGLGLSLWQWMGLGLTVCVFGTWGDLVESLFKRQLGIKDSGTILPGHGGMLDRFDSALLALPAALCYLHFAANF